MSGFQTTGTRINFRGHVHGDYGYWARLQADEFGADPIFDALAGIYRFNDDTIMAFGQFPNVLTREQGLAVETIQAVEASPTNVVFDPFAFKGAILGYHMPRMIVRGIINDGYRSFANGIDNLPEGPSADWAFAGQVIGMAIGDESDWDRFNNITSRRGSDFAWQVDGAFHAQSGPDIYLGIVQSSLEGDGWTSTRPAITGIRTKSTTTSAAKTSGLSSKAATGPQNVPRCMDATTSPGPTATARWRATPSEPLLLV